MAIKQLFEDSKKTKKLEPITVSSAVTVDLEKFKDESLNSVITKLDRDAEIVSIETKVSNLESDVTNLRSDVNDLDIRVSETESNLTILDSEVNSLESKVDDITYTYTQPLTITGKAVGLAVDNSTIKVVGGKLVADVPSQVEYVGGDNIEITSEGVINATYKPGANITIVDGVISASGTLASTAWGQISGSISNQTDLAAALSSKADTSSLDAKADKTSLDLKADKTELEAKADKTDLPTKVSDLTNDSGYITSTSLEGYRKTTDQAVVDAGQTTRIEELTAAELVLDSEVGRLGVAVSGKQDKLIGGVNLALINGINLLTNSYLGVKKIASGTEEDGMIFLAGETDTAVNLKTVNNESLIGTGNISVSGGTPTWGSITGTLTNQTDLKNALDSKATTASVELKADKTSVPKFEYIESTGTLNITVG